MVAVSGLIKYELRSICIASRQINKKSSVKVSPERWLPTVNVYHHIELANNGASILLLGT